MLRRQRSLGLLDLTAQLLDGATVFAHVFSRLLLVQLDEVIHDTLVEVFAAEVSVSVGSHHFEDAVIDGQQGHVESTTAKVKHQDVLLTVLLVQAVSDGSCSSAMTVTKV